MMMIKVHGNQKASFGWYKDPLQIPLAPGYLQALHDPPPGLFGYKPVETPCNS